MKIPCPSKRTRGVAWHPLLPERRASRPRRDRVDEDRLKRERASNVQLLLETAVVRSGTGRPSRTSAWRSRRCSSPRRSRRRSCRGTTPFKACCRGSRSPSGYGVGVFFVWLWHYLEIPDSSASRPARQQADHDASRSPSWSRLFLWRATIWQNSIRELMEMEPVETAYPWRVAVIALVTGVLADRRRARLRIALAVRRSQNQPRRSAPRLLRRHAPFCRRRRLLLIVNDVFARLALNAADAHLSGARPESSTTASNSRPSATASGSAESLIAWDTIGRRGKEFIAAGPTQGRDQRVLGRRRHAAAARLRRPGLEGNDRRARQAGPRRTRSASADSIDRC